MISISARGGGLFSPGAWFSAIPAKAKRALPSEHAALARQDFAWLSLRRSLKPFATYRLEPCHEIQKLAGDGLLPEAAELTLDLI